MSKELPIIQPEDIIRDYITAVDNDELDQLSFPPESLMRALVGLSYRLIQAEKRIDDMEELLRPKSDDSGIEQFKNKIEREIRRVNDQNCPGNQIAKSAHDRFEDINADR